MAWLQNCDYDHFPRATQSPEGMKTLRADKDLPGLAMAGNVVYGQRDGLPLHLQVIYPIYAPYAAESKQVYPCLVHIHGSGWRKQDVYRRIPSLAALAQKGYVIASVEYRPSAVGAFPAQIQDAKAAIRYLRLHCEEYHGDPNRIAVMGDSSGGHTSLMVHLTQGEDFFEPGLYPDVSDRVSGCLDLYGPTDLASMMDEPTCMDHASAASPEGILMGNRAIGEVPPEELRRADAASWVSPTNQLPPTLILHGDKDDTVPFAQSVRIYEALRGAGQDVTFYKLENAGHGGPEFWTEELLALYDAFFQRCFAT
jgi:acetyl esterase/lipase